MSLFSWKNSRRFHYKLIHGGRLFQIPWKTLHFANKTNVTWINIDWQFWLVQAKKELVYITPIGNSLLTKTSASSQTSKKRLELHLFIEGCKRFWRLFSKANHLETMCRYGIFSRWSINWWFILFKLCNFSWIIRFSIDCATGCDPCRLWEIAPLRIRRVLQKCADWLNIVFLKTQN